MTSPFLAAALAWLAEDPDPDTRAELQSLLDLGSVDAGNVADAELADRFGSQLEFGTAGLRGALGAGPNRMNQVVVLRAAAGLARYLLDTGGHSIVIGYDARHKSDVFARATASVMAGAGIRALLLPQALPTPVLAYAIRSLATSAGVMVTASHNPARDNGYKVYLGDGGQIVPPADAEIAKRINAVGRLAEIPRSDDWQILDDSVTSSYIEAVSSQRLLATLPARDIRIVYTPLHGVGLATFRAALSRSGFTSISVVAAQAEPDPDFPTVAFPNPEEPGAIDLALELARAENADIVLANDPDADRCAVAVPNPSVDTTGDPADDAASGVGWRMLHGDEVGILLADFLLRQGVSGRYATSIVSSSALSEMAKRHGMPYSETLTGSKWIAQTEGLVFGYEEALGYLVMPELLRDKDGISAAVLIALMAATLRAEGKTLLDQLESIWREYGLYATKQISVRVNDIAQISAAVEQLRQSPPSALGGLPVVLAEDLAKDGGSSGLPMTNALRYRLDGSARGQGPARVIVRPSGTEAKLKSYLEVVMTVSGSLDSAQQAAREQLDAIGQELSAALGL